VYDQFCIPVFGDPSSPMGAANNYSCDFLNVGATNTSFVVLHDDRWGRTDTVIFQFFRGCGLCLCGEGGAFVWDWFVW
jgi:hypothetical protein